MKEAMLYSKENGNKARCSLCRHSCLIEDGEHGICNVRLNRGGTLYSIFYGKPIALSPDPIEKKPLFHYKPGTSALSIATPGCNFQCDFCQNWDISQYGRDGSDRIPKQEIAPKIIVRQAIENKCDSISYTYTEPTIFFEYAYDTAILAKPEGIGNTFVTNGYMTREALDVIHPYLDAANVDLKAFRKDTYRKVIKAQLDGVLDSIKYMKQLGVWVEVTTLIVPGMNDSEAELKDIANFLVETGRDIPWHISRFVPHYRMDSIAPTPLDTLKRAYDIGREAGLRYIYLGNVPGDESENTRCYNCGSMLIERCGYSIQSNVITNKSECPSCKTKVDGIDMGVAGN
ncbi:MAG: AmmeMemoRadiSam system radical SAM enzyme [Deltaproteobacteria bacterium]|jgi:pyruvate formate lyase activating enzyme|nr:AmmeMemoRadiSam system radical SAM enzyme [Deltaproteobacteria bacterium]